MKRSSLFCLAVLCSALVALSCGGSKPSAPAAEAPKTEAAPIAPVIDTSKASTIETQLSAYADLVDRYLAAKASADKPDLGSYETELASIGEALSALAVDFSEAQLARFTEITAKLDN